jgi:hypothetical protein
VLEQELAESEADWKVGFEDAAAASSPSKLLPLRVGALTSLIAFCNARRLWSGTTPPTATATTATTPT